MFQKKTLFVLLLCVSVYHLTACSPVVRQHALVVGIDNYKQADDRLKGAVNDAKLLTKSLRDNPVLLPEERVLLDEQATRANVIQAWRNMLAQANPGDTLIFTYAGHGSQKEDAEPKDEADKQDETLVLYDDEISDDELTDLFIKAKAYNILFLADACHAAGLTRDGKPATCRSRFAETTFHRQASPLGTIEISTLGDEQENAARLNHLTFISAADSDNVSVCEFAFEDEKTHGALSWFFAKALAGYADGNRNKGLEREELKNYLTTQIGNHTSQLYKPKLRPESGSEVVIRLAQDSVTPIPPDNPNLRDVAIKVENGSAPSGLKAVKHVKQGFELRFVVEDEADTAVYNKLGDQVTTVFSQKADTWQRVIDKAQLLQALSTQFDMRLKPVQIDLKEGNGVHRKGERLHFSIAPTDRGEELNALTLFNLAGDGELQFLYPLALQNHALMLEQFPYELKPLKIVAPFGGDHLVAILCTQPPTVLQTLLKDSAPYLPKPAEVIFALRQQRCQVGQYAFFSAAD